MLATSFRVLSGLTALATACRRQGVLPSPAGRVLASHALIALVAAAIRDAGQLDSVPEAELRSRLALGLTVGSPHDTHILDVLSDADALLRDVVEEVHNAYSSTGAKRAEVEVPSLRSLVAEPPTDLLDHYLALVKRLRSNPTIARDLLQTAELACFDALVGDDSWLAPAFDHLFTSEHGNLLAVAHQALANICGPAIADALEPLSRISFDRSAPTVPDRTAPYKPGGST
jgi:hypothetical protein